MNFDVRVIPGEILSTHENMRCAAKGGEDRK